MTRLICLLAPLALVTASGCVHCGCGDPDPTPTHTFGQGGVVDRAGGLRGPREYCPMCEWAGTKCAACRAKEARFKAHPQDQESTEHAKEQSVLLHQKRQSEENSTE